MIGLAREIATKGVRVKGVRPRPIRTEIHASGGEPEEVASTILWLLSDEASSVTGTIVDVSGVR